MGEIIISTAKMEDAEELNRIECAAFPSAEAASLESYKYRITNINDWFLKAEEDGKIVGLICCRPVAIEGVTDDMYEPEPVADGKVICILSVATEPNLQRRGIGGVPGLALLHVVLGGLIHLEIDEAQLQIALVVADGTHVREDLAQAGIQEPLIGFLLDLQQVGHRHDLFVPGKILTQGFAVILILGHLQYSRLSCFYLNLICLLFSGLLRGARRITCDTHGLVASFMGHPLVFFADRWYPMNRL